MNLNDFITNMTMGFIIGILMLPITYFVNKHLFEIDKKRRWEKVSKIVIRQLNNELCELFMDTKNMFKFDNIISSSKKIVFKDIPKIINQKSIKELKEYVNNNKKLEFNHLYYNSLLKGKYIKLFNERKEIFANFELKYIEYIDDELITSLINIQERLDKINIAIQLYIQNKKKKNNFLQLDENKFENDLKELFLSIFKSLNKLSEKKYFNYKI
jgi:hypothetical protein